MTTVFCRWSCASDLLLVYLKLMFGDNIYLLTSFPFFKKKSFKKLIIRNNEEENAVSNFNNPDYPHVYMNQIPIQVLSKMLANVLEGVGDNFVTFLVITNNGTKNNLVASALPGCVQWPCW